MRFFETKFLEEANEFISQLDPKTIKKVFYNIDLAEQTNDPKLFKKLQNDIWEFRTKFAGLQIRLLAFWDKTDNKETLDLIKRRNQLSKEQELANANTTGEDIRRAEYLSERSETQSIIGKMNEKLAEQEKEKKTLS